MVGRAGIEPATLCLKGQNEPVPIGVECYQHTENTGHYSTISSSHLPGFPSLPVPLQYRSGPAALRKTKAPQLSQKRGHEAKTISFLFEDGKSLHSRGLKVKAHLNGAKGGTS